MHPSSLNNMQLVRSKFLQNLPKNLTILDVGGRGLGKDRSYKNIFLDLSPTYNIADIVDGEGVTHVMPDPYTLPFFDNSIDLIVSGQTLEHVKNPFKMVNEMTRVVKLNSYIIIIAPSAGPRHDAIDCWRFMDNAFQAIAEETNLKIVADWIDKDSKDERSLQWKDHVFVGQK